MYCSRCGAQNPEDAEVCIECGKPVGHKKSEAPAAANEPTANAATGREPGFCPQCGAQHQGGSDSCGNCGSSLDSEVVAPTAPPASYGHAPPPPGQPYQQQPYQQQQYASVVNPGWTDYMTHSIILSVVSFCCCCQPISLVLGIIAIVFASSSRTKLAAGDVHGAKEAANTSRILFYIGLGLIVFSIIAWIVYAVFAGGVSALAPMFESQMNNLDIQSW